MTQYEESNFATYTIREGLSENSITWIEQDGRGYIWVGTDAGLNRFDGNHFKQYFSGNKPLGLLSASIWKLKRLSKDELGVCTHNGFYVLNTVDYSVRSFRIADSTPISAYLNHCWDGVRFDDGNYGISTATGFYVYSNKGALLKRFDAYTNKDIGTKRILYARDILRLSGKEYIVYIRENEIAVYNTESKTFQEMKDGIPSGSGLKGSLFEKGEYWSVRFQLSEDEFIFLRGGYDKAVYYNHRQKKTVESPIWHGIVDSINWDSRLIRLNDTLLALNNAVTGFNLLKVDRKTGQIITDPARYLPNSRIQCLFLDQDKRLWAGTPVGLMKQDLQPPFINAIRYDHAGEKFTYGFSAVFRYKDKIYASRFSYRKGLAIMDAHSMKLLREISFISDDTMWNEIRNMEMYHKDTLWLGTNGGLLWFDTRSERYGKVFDEKKYPWGKEFFPVLAPPDKNGNAWMCSFMDGKLVRYHIPTRTYTLYTARTNPALPFERVKHIVYDAYGDVWIGGHALARWNHTTQQFDTLITAYGGENKYNDDIVSLRADDRGSLWMHNSYNGLLEYRIRDKKFIAYSMKNGLPSDVFVSLSPVIGNNLWLAGNSQLCLFDIVSKKSTVYDYHDGLPDHKPTSKRIYLDEVDSILYLCCNDYLVKFKPAPPVSSDRSSPLLIEELIVNQEKEYYYPQTSVSIPNDRNNISIDYTVIDYDKGYYQFAWRLNGQGNWTVTGNQRNINISNLPPGKYRLEIKAAGKPGVEKMGYLSFSIRPPLWKTPWFIGLFLLVAGGLAYYLYRRRVKYIRQTADLDRQLSQTEMKALQAQMNPHFIFNSLNSIREMILNNENKDASHYLSKFAHLIRITLDQSGHPLVSLYHTADYLQRYLEMEKIRNNLLNYEINISEDLDADETMVPPMLIQPFIENALWHGVTAADKAITVKVNFKREGEKLVCIIEDNGIGIHQSLQNKTGSLLRHKPHGIDNIRNRIALLNEKYNLYAQVDIRDKKEIPGAKGTGTIVILHLALEMGNI